MATQKDTNASTTGGPAKAGGATLVVLAAILGFLDNVSTGLRNAFGAVTTAVSKFPWGSHFPALARTVADMMDLEPSFFAWVPFSSAQLRTLEGEVLQLTEVRSFLGGLVDYVGQLLTAKRQDLITKTLFVVDGLQRLKDSPETTPDKAARLDEISQAVNDVIANRNDAIQGKKVKTQEQNQANQQLIDQNQQLSDEVQALRGDQPASTKTAPAPAVAAKAKKARKSAAKKGTTGKTNKRASRRTTLH